MEIEQRNSHRTSMADKEIDSTKQVTSIDSSWTLFLDRDGVINVDHVGAIHSVFRNSGYMKA
ncbi:hypothetical protein [Arachidicoccus ginsenosidivorans]|uniref:hypothetical protein n=1 Tax=Arachidicoccus ginsenosidivorans TaxID=496057 RepID=UPI0013153AD7|nr:hypothetical protein [Arachidicoccus ginsenosidivorans]